MTHATFILTVIVLVSSALFLARVWFMRADAANPLAGKLRPFALGWFLLSLGVTINDYFFILPPAYRPFHEYLRPITLLLEGWLFAAALGVALEAPVSRLRRLQAAGLAPFAVVAAVAFAGKCLGSAEAAELALTASIVLSSLSSCILLVTFARRLRSASKGKRAAFAIGAAFFASVLSLFAFTSVADPAVFEPIVSVAFFAFWSSLFFAASLVPVAAREELSPAAAPIVLSPESLQEAFGLSRREAEVCARIGAGNSNKEIAWELGIAEATVKKHLGSAFAKTGTGSRLDLLRLLASRGELPPK